MLHDLPGGYQAALFLEIIALLLPLTIWAVATLDDALDRWLAKHPPRSHWFDWRMAAVRR